MTMITTASGNALATKLEQTMIHLLRAKDSLADTEEIPHTAEDRKKLGKWEEDVYSLGLAISQYRTNLVRRRK